MPNKECLYFKIGDCFVCFITFYYYFPFILVFTMKYLLSDIISIVTFSVTPAPYVSLGYAEPWYDSGVTENESS